MPSVRNALFALLGLLLVTGSVSLRAQVSVAGIISGAVVDASGAVIPNATITVTNEGTGAERKATSNGSGSFVVVGLEPGTYSVGVALQGFGPATRKGLVLTANERLSV